MTIATCRGTRSRGITGGRAPLGCGEGGRTGGRRGLTLSPLFGPLSLALDQAQRPQAALDVPLQVRRRQPAHLALHLRLGGVGDGPVAFEKRDESDSG